MDDPHPITYQPLRQHLLTAGAPFYPVNQRTSDGTYTWTDTSKVIINGVIVKHASTNSTAQQATGRQQTLRLYDIRKGGAGQGTGETAWAGKGKSLEPPVAVQDPVQTWQGICEASTCLVKSLHPDMQLQDVFPEVAGVVPGLRTVEVNGVPIMQFWAEVQMATYLIPVFQSALTDPEGPLAAFPVPGPAGAPLKGAFRLSPFGRPGGPKGSIPAVMFLGHQHQGGSLPYHQIGNQILSQFGGEYLDCRVTNLMAEGKVRNGDLATGYETAALDPDLAILDFHLEKKQGSTKQVLIVPHTSQVYDDLQAAKYLRLCKGDRTLLTLYLEAEPASPYALAVNLRVLPDKFMQSEIMYEVGKLTYKGYQVALAGAGDHPLGDIPPSQLILRSSLGEEVVWRTDLLPTKRDLSAQDLPTNLSELFFTGTGTPLYPESDTGVMRCEHILINLSTRESLLGVLLGMASSGEQPYLVSAGGGDPRGLPLELALSARPVTGRLWAGGALSNFPAPGKSPWSPGLPAQPRTAAALLAVFQSGTTDKLVLPSTLPPMEEIKTMLGKKMKAICLAVVKPAQIKAAAPTIDWFSLICPTGIVETPASSTAINHVSSVNPPNLGAPNLGAPNLGAPNLGAPNVGDKRNHAESECGGPSAMEAAGNRDETP